MKQETVQLTHGVEVGRASNGIPVPIQGVLNNTMLGGANQHGKLRGYQCIDQIQLINCFQGAKFFFLGGGIHKHIVAVKTKFP